MTMPAEKHLLFGLLALQNGIIDQVQLVAGFQAWTLDKSRSLADHLEDRGDLNRARRAVLEALLGVYLEAHDGDVTESLRGVAAGKSARESLARIGDSDIEATLGCIETTHALSDGDPDRTGTYLVGTSTSNGQRFRIIRPYAQGALGAVFVARDGELNREVALKQILDHHADDPVVRQRFLIEAEITGGLEHPGIVPVYGLGTDGDGRPYYAMRLIRGDTLKEAIGRFHQSRSSATDPGARTVELRKFLNRFTDVCNAIEYAHSRGVVHRDIKPGNIIVGKYGETLVADWGLAKPLGKIDPSAESGEKTLKPSPGGSSVETLPGSAIGTPAYMSPEQAAGDLGRLDARSDVYSLGATLYCLLTGRAPFDGDVGRVLNAVQKGEFPPPRRLDPSIDAALESVCLKAMALEPSDRYSSARALADDVDRWLADEPVVARREGWGQRLARWSRRHRAWVRAGVAALVLVTFVSIFAWARLRAAQTGNLKLTASLGLARGQSLCEQGLTGDGLLWLTQSLRLCPDSDVELQRDIRNYIGYWIDQVHPLRAQIVLAGEISALAFSPDGKTVVSCTKNAPVRLWDPASGLPIGAPLEDQGGVLCASFAPDGTRVLTGGRDGTARFWDTRTGAGIGPVLHLDGAVMCVAFSPDGRLAAGGGGGNRGRIWEVATGRRVGAELLHPPNSEWHGFLGTIAFSPDGRRVFTASRDGTFRFWNTADGLPAAPGGKHQTYAFSASLSGDGRRVLTVGPTGAQVWDAESGNAEGPLWYHHDAALVGAFHPVRPWVAIGFADGTTSVWDLSTPSYKLLSRTDQGGSVRALAFTPDGQSLITGSDDGTARVWEISTGRPLGGPLYHPSKRLVTALAVSPDSRCILTGCQDGVSRSWGFGPSRSFAPKLSNGGEVWFAAFSPDGRFALTGGGDQPLRVWESRTGRPVGRPMEHRDAMYAAFSPDGRFAVTASYSGVVRLWEIPTGALILDRPSTPGTFAAVAHGPRGFLLVLFREDGEVSVIDPKGEAVYPTFPAKGNVRVASLSVDGTIAAVGGNDGDARIWDVATGRQLARIPSQGHPVETLSFSVDGRVLMVAYKDSTARIWDVRTGTMIGRALNHPGRIRAVALSPDGRLAATGGYGRTIRLWDTATGVPVGPGYSAAGAVIALAFSPDGRLILAGDGDEAARFWDVAPAITEGEARLALRASLMTNLEFDDAGNLVPLAPERWEQLRRALPDQIVRRKEPTVGKADPGNLATGSSP